MAVRKRHFVTMVRWKLGQKGVRYFHWLPRKRRAGGPPKFEKAFQYSFSEVVLPLYMAVIMEGE